MSQPPACELHAGSKHDTDPPPAIGRFLLRWTTSDGESQRSVKALCGDCYDDKVAEFKDLVRERGTTHCVEVIGRFAGGKRLPVHAGRHTGKD